MSDNAQLVLIDDGNPMVPALTKSLNAGFSVVRINGARVKQADLAGAKAVVVCLNNSAFARYLVDLPSLTLSLSKTVFVFPTHNNESITWLSQLGVHEFFVAPVANAALWTAVQQVLNRGVEASWKRLPPVIRDAMVTSRSTLGACFGRVRNGQPLDLGNVTKTCGYIGSAMMMIDFSDWLSIIRMHHDYTYRHSMFVCGALTRFAQEIGFGTHDLEIMTAGAILHDVGKSRTPQSILDKPTKLDDAEWAVMRKHPSHSRNILFRESELDPRIVAMAVHHHEKLDGTGYPDGLPGAQIADHIRLMSVADVFSALVDERSYKPSMSPEDALNRMLEFKGHLDLGLVNTFKEFILDNNAIYIGVARRCLSSACSSPK